MKIYFVMSIVQLKFVSKNDSYERFYNTNSSLVKKEIEKNVDLKFVFKYKFYKIERFLKRRDIEKNIIYLIK